MFRLVKWGLVAFAAYMTEDMASRGADKGKAGQVDADAARRRTFADHQVERPVLHRRIEHFLHCRIEPMNLVDEQHIALFQMRDLPEFGGGVETALGTMRRYDIKDMEYQIEHIKWAMEKALKAGEQ